MENKKKEEVLKAAQNLLKEMDALEIVGEETDGTDEVKVYCPTYTYCSGGNCVAGCGAPDPGVKTGSNCSGGEVKQTEGCSVQTKTQCT